MMAPDFAYAVLRRAITLANLDVYVGDSHEAAEVMRFFPYAGGDAPRD